MSGPWQTNWFLQSFARLHITTPPVIPCFKDSIPFAYACARTEGSDESRGCTSRIDAWISKRGLACVGVLLQRVQISLSCVCWGANWCNGCWKSSCKFLLSRNLGWWSRQCDARSFATSTTFKTVTLSFRPNSCSISGSSEVWQNTYVLATKRTFHSSLVPAFSLSEQKENNQATMPYFLSSLFTIHTTDCMNQWFKPSWLEVDLRRPFTITRTPLPSQVSSLSNQASKSLDIKISRGRSK